MKTEKDKTEKSEKSTVKVAVGGKSASSSKSVGSGDNARSSKVFDVMRPGRAPASPTSRPVVMGHQAGAEASQVSVSGIGESAPRSLLDSRKKVTIAGPGVAPADDSDMAPASPDMETSSSDTPAAQWTSATHKTIQPLGEPAVAKPNGPPGAPPLPDDVSPDAPLATGDVITLKDPASPKSSGDLNPRANEDLGLQEDEAKLDEVAAEPEDPAPLPPAPTAPVPPAEVTLGDTTPASTPASQNAAAVNAPEASKAQADHLLQNLSPDDLDEEHVVISHHAVHGAGKAVLAVIIIVVLAAIIIDILFDAGIIDSMGIPHTEFF